MNKHKCPACGRMAFRRFLKLCGECCRNETVFYRFLEEADPARAARVQQLAARALNRESLYPGPRRREAI